MSALDKTPPGVDETAEIVEPVPLREQLKQTQEQLQFLKCAMDRITESVAWLDLDGGLSKARTDAEKLQQAEEIIRLFKRSIDSAGDYISWMDMDGHYLATNEEVARGMGYTQEEMRGMPIAQIMPSFPKSPMQAGVMNVFETTGPGLFEGTFKTWDNQLISVEIQGGKPFLFKGKKYHFGIGRDITSRKKFEGIHLQTMATQQEALLNNIPHCAWIKDVNLQYTAVNEAYARFCNRTREEMIGLTDFDLWPQEWAEKFNTEELALIENGGKIHFEAFMTSPQGKPFWGELFKTPVLYDLTSRVLTGCVGILQDITDRKAAEVALQKAHVDLAKQLRERELLESQLVQAQKMKAIGQLASGVAHDFNSLLTVMMGRLKLLESHITDDDGRHTLHAATQAAERAAKLTKQLLAFARKQPLYPHAVDLNDLLQEMDLLLQNALSDKVHLEKVPAEDLWPALADVNQVQLAILNLVSNACEAMPNGGLLRIGAGNIRIHSGSETPASDLEPGEYIRLFVSDTGTGMSEEVLSQAFEPFFTTKGVGRGIGLGLSQVYGLAKQLGGTAQLKSTLGEGTTAELFLPRAVESGNTPEN